MCIGRCDFLVGRGIRFIRKAWCTSRFMEIDNHALRSYDSIALELGVSRRAVIETEQRALRKLRKAFARLGLMPQKGRGEAGPRSPFRT